MYVGRDFTPSDPGENEIYTLDFVNDLADNEGILTAIWSCSLVEGADANPSAHVSGPSSTDGSKVSQRITDLLGGCLYRLEAVVTTNQGNTKSLWSHVRCNTPS